MKNNPLRDYLAQFIEEPQAAGTAPEIAKHFGRNPTTVHYHARKLGIPLVDGRHTPLQKASPFPERNAAIVAEVRATGSLKKVAAAYGLTGERVRQIAARAGVRLHQITEPNHWRVCEVCGDRKRYHAKTTATRCRKHQKTRRNPPISLACFFCGRLYEISGIRLRSYKTNRKRYPNSKNCCPACFSQRVSLYSSRQPAPRTTLACSCCGTLFQRADSDIRARAKHSPQIKVLCSPCWRKHGTGRC